MIPSLRRTALRLGRTNTPYTSVIHAEVWKTKKGNPSVRFASHLVRPSPRVQDRARLWRCTLNPRSGSPFEFTLYSVTFKGDAKALNQILSMYAVSIGQPRFWDVACEACAAKNTRICNFVGETQVRRIVPPVYDSCQFCASRAATRYERSFTPSFQFPRNVSPWRLPITITLSSPTA